MILLQDAYEERLKHIETIKEAPKQKKKTYYEKTTEKIRKDDERIEIIDKIYLFLLDNPEIKLDFYNSVIKFFQTHGYITSGQYNTLVKIYHQFEMNKHEKEDTQTNTN